MGLSPEHLIRQVHDPEAIDPDHPPRAYPGDEARGRFAGAVLRACADFLESCRDDADAVDITVRRGRFYAALDAIGEDGRGGSADHCGRVVYAALRDARYLD